jgi:hypothetical protein
MLAWGNCCEPGDKGVPKPFLAATPCVLGRDVIAITSVRDRTVVFTASRQDPKTPVLRLLTAAMAITALP